MGHLGSDPGKMGKEMDGEGLEHRKISQALPARL
jgi:hypothetical protein